VSPAKAASSAKWKGKVIDFEELNLERYSLIIDALFGIGLHKDPRGSYKDIISRIGVANKKIVSIDIPSGIDSDTGEILGRAIRAELTVTFEYKKPAFVLTSLQKYFGKVIVKAIGLALKVPKAFSRQSRIIYKNKE